MELVLVGPDTFSLTGSVHHVELGYVTYSWAHAMRTELQTDSEIGLLGYFANYTSSVVSHSISYDVLMH